jgi:predicted P-loop ATPase
MLGHENGPGDSSLPGQERDFLLGEEHRSTAQSSTGDWWDALPSGYLSDNNTGEPKRSKIEGADLVDLLNGNLRERLWWNDYGKQIVLDGKQIDDQGLNLAYLKLGHRGYKIAKQDARDAFVQAALNRKRNTLHEFLLAVEANPAIQPADVQRLATRYLRPCDEFELGPTLYDRFMLKTLIGAINRAFAPGCKFDYVTVLQGPQGCLKSTFWQKLFGEMFCGVFTGKIDTADARLLLQRRWVLELAEIDRYTRGACAAEIKAFLTAETDLIRAPYASTHADYPRPSITVASCNEGAFLKDDTGNRRFWVIPVAVSSQIDLALLGREHLGIWKAAMAAWRAGERPYLTQIEEAQANVDVQQFAEESALLSAIDAFLRSKPAQVWFHKHTIQEHVGGLNLRVNAIQADRQIKQAMRELGWKDFRPRVEGRRPKVWCKSGFEDVASKSLRLGETDVPKAPVR